MNNEVMKSEITKNEIIKLESIDSTHKFAIRLIENSNVRECVIIARNQTNGVGRCERLWQSLEGNLFMSVIKKIPQNNNMEFGRLSLTIACAVHEAILSYVSDDLYLHWPNDIYYKRSKIAGILITAMDDWIIISIGVNVNSTPSITSAVSLKDVLRSKNISTEDMMDDILNSLNKWFKNFDSFGFFYIKEYWLRYINEIDCTVTIKNGFDSILGVFRGIDDSGRLILEKDNKNLFISSGDMFLDMKGIVVNHE